jgi:hypothetical protein
VGFSRGSLSPTFLKYRQCVGTQITASQYSLGQDGQSLGHLLTEIYLLPPRQTSKLTVTRPENPPVVDTGLDQVELSHHQSGLL